MLDQGARELGMSQKAYYGNGEYVAEGRLRLLTKYGHDNVWSLFYVGKEAELLAPTSVLYHARDNVAVFLAHDSEV
jgi:uroporphyrinogen decarboxylase